MIRAGIHLQVVRQYAYNLHISNQISGDTPLHNLLQIIPPLHELIDFLSSQLTNLQRVPDAQNCNLRGLKGDVGEGAYLQKPMYADLEMMRKGGRTGSISVSLGRYQYTCCVSWGSKYRAWSSCTPTRYVEAPGLPPIMPRLCGNVKVALKDGIYLHIIIPNIKFNA